jgi:hypothetical protein
MVKHLEEFCGVSFVWRALYIHEYISRRDIMPTPLRVGGILCLLGIGIISR